jgi:hypothetical protein
MGSAVEGGNNTNHAMVSDSLSAQGDPKLSKRSGPNAPGVAFVTGGARGLGNAIAVSYAREGARAVVIVDIQGEKICEAGTKAVEAYGTEVGSLGPSLCLSTKLRHSNQADFLLTIVHYKVPSHQGGCYAGEGGRSSGRRNRRKVWQDRLCRVC